VLVAVHNRREIANQTIIAYDDQFLGDNLAALIDEDPVANLQPPTLRGSEFTPNLTASHEEPPSNGDAPFPTKQGTFPFDKHHATPRARDRDTEIEWNGSPVEDGLSHGATADFGRPSRFPVIQHRHTIIYLCWSDMRSNLLAAQSFPVSIGA
jgi:hypothetical protein